MRYNSRGGQGAGIIFVAALAAVLIALTLGITYRRVMVVKNVEVTGVDEELANEVRRLSGVNLGQSIYDVDRRRIAINLRANGYIKLCEVEIERPDTVRIAVKQRTKAAALQHLGFTYVVDEEMNVLECCSGLSEAGTMIVTGAPIQQTPVGMPVNMDEQKRSQLGYIISGIGGAGVADMISEINVASLQNIYIVTRSGYVFRIGSTDDIEAKLKWIRPVEAQLRAEGRPSGTVDITSGIAADYIPAGSAPEAAAPAGDTFLPAASKTP